METGRSDARGAARWSDEVGPGGQEVQELNLRARAGAVKAISGSESVRMDRERPGSAEPVGWEPGGAGSVGGRPSSSWLRGGTGEPFIAVDPRTSDPGVCKNSHNLGAGISKSL